MKIDLTPLEVASQIANIISTQQNPSLPEYTKSTRLSPTVLIDKTVMTLEAKQINALMQTMLSIYSGYYLTAVNLTMNVGNINVIRLLDQFSTDRSLLSSAGNSIWWGNEDIGLENMTMLPDFSMEAVAVNVPDSLLNSNIPHIPNARLNKPYDNKDNIHNITDESNLAVGKLLEVKLVSGDTMVTMPVNVILAPKVIEADDFVAIEAHLNVDKSISGRYHAWRSGQIKFFSDYLLAFDLVEANRKALMSDKTGTLLRQQSTQSKGLLASVISGKISPNAISTMVVISKATAQRIEPSLGGRLTDYGVRTKYFKNNATMMLIVVDTRMERFTIYQRGINDYSELTFDDIAANSKKSNSTDIGSIVSAYKLGNAATL